MDAAFLRTIAAAPADRLARLVYADWLDDQPGATAAGKSAFLRLTADLGGDAAGEDDPRREKLRELAAGLDADWLAVVSDLRVENCASKRADPNERPGFRFRYVCDRRWGDLAPTDAAGVRFCDACRESVYYCETVAEARDHVGNKRCVALDLRTPRALSDLKPGMMVGGGSIL